MRKKFHLIWKILSDFDVLVNRHSIFPKIPAGPPPPFRPPSMGGDVPQGPLARQGFGGLAPEFLTHESGESRSRPTVFIRWHSRRHPLSIPHRCAHPCKPSGFSGFFRKRPPRYNEPSKREWARRCRRSHTKHTQRIASGHPPPFRFLS